MCAELESHLAFVWCVFWRQSTPWGVLMVRIPPTINVCMGLAALCLALTCQTANNKSGGKGTNATERRCCSSTSSFHSSTLLQITRKSKTAQCTTSPGGIRGDSGLKVEGGGGMTDLRGEWGEDGLWFCQTFNVSNSLSSALSSFLLGYQRTIIKIAFQLLLLLRSVRYCSGFFLHWPLCRPGLLFAFIAFCINPFPFAPFKVQSLQLRALRLIYELGRRTRRMRNAHIACGAMKMYFCTAHSGFCLLKCLVIKTCWCQWYSAEFSQTMWDFC